MLFIIEPMGKEEGGEVDRAVVAPLWVSSDRVGTHDKLVQSASDRAEVAWPCLSVLRHFPVERNTHSLRD